MTNEIEIPPIYILNHYSDLLTKEERSVWTTIQFRLKSDATRSGVVRRHLAELADLDAPEVKGLLKDGDKAFMMRVRDRVMKTHADQVFINCCPKCSIIQKNPECKLCHSCYHFWREG